MMCLCPFIYYGNECTMLRGIFCYLDKERVESLSSTEATLQFDIECFLKEYDDGASKKKINNYHKLPMSEEDIELELQQNNYYIDPAMQIVWAN